MSKMPDYEVPFQAADPSTISLDTLAPIDYQYMDRRDIEICITQPEFTSVCPLSGLPDFGSIIITYVPNKKIVEMKSLQYYLLQYRNVGIFYEHVVNRILDDMVEVLGTKRMEVLGKFTSRGGIEASVKAVFDGDN